MAFIRVKNRIYNGKGFDYAYLVENKWGRYGPRQKINMYLGRIYKFDIVKEILFEIKGNSYREMLKFLYEYELRRCGFYLENGVFVNNNCYIDLDNLMVYNKNGRKIVLQINAGFICGYSLKELFNLKIEDNDVGRKMFAKKLVLGGLDVKPEVFVELYRRLMLRI